jgi:hypothetical protein
VYFKGFPAYLDYGLIDFAESGQAVLFADYDERKMEYRVCVDVPERILQAIGQRGKLRE